MLADHTCGKLVVTAVAVKHVEQGASSVQHSLLVQIRTLKATYEAPHPPRMGLRAQEG